MTKVKRGDKVIDRYGKVFGVRGQIGNTIYLENGEWIHAANCWKLFWSRALGCVTIPQD